MDIWATINRKRCLSGNGTLLLVQKLNRDSRNTTHEVYTKSVSPRQPTCTYTQFEPNLKHIDMFCIMANKNKHLQRLDEPLKLNLFS